MDGDEVKHCIAMYYVKLDFTAEKKTLTIFTFYNQFINQYITLISYKHQKNYLVSLILISSNHLTKYSNYQY
jgi:hypothetical protein